MNKPIYNRVGWVLGQCLACARLHYVEPHGTDAPCVCNEDRPTKHRNIPQDCRDMGGVHCIRKPELEPR